MQVGKRLEPCRCAARRRPHLFWIKDKSLTDTDLLPPPDVLATEIADDLEAALEQFTKIAARLAKTAVAG